jgi:heme exporter protein D
MSEFLAMGGYAWYVWMAYGAAALVIALEIVAVRARRRRALDELRMRAEASPPPPSVLRPGSAR